MTHTSAIETELPLETDEPIFGTNIGQHDFTPSPSPNDQPVSKHNGEKSGDTVPLDLPSPGSPDF